MANVNYEGGAESTISNLTVTGTLNFDTAGTYYLVDCAINIVTSSVPGVILVLDNSTITDSTDPNITTEQAGIQISFSSVTTGANIRIYDDTNTEVDQDINSSGPFQYTTPNGATGTYGYVINLRGYFPIIGTFDPSANDISINGTLTEKKLSNGTSMYQVGLSDYLSVTTSGGFMYLDFDNGSVSVQEAFTEVEEYLETADGMKYLYEGGGEVSIALLSVGSFLFLGTNIRLRNDGAHVNATLNGYAESQDGIVVSGANSILYNTISPSSQIAAHQGSVWIDAVNGFTGIDFPTGTSFRPVNNLSQAISIANNLGLVDIRTFSTVTIDEDVGGFSIHPAGGSQTIVLDISGSVDKCVIEEMFVTGQQVGTVLMKNCSLNNLSGMQGTYRNVGFGNTFSVDESAVRFNLFDCYSIVAGDTKPVCDMTGVTDCGVNNRNWSGGFELANCTSANNKVSIDVASGSIKLASTVTAGDIVVRGIGALVNESSGATVNTDGFNPNMEESEMHTVLDNYTNKDDWKGTTTAEISGHLNTINEGVKKSSIMVPHNTDL
jgi:hypothetical protein